MIRRRSLAAEAPRLRLERYWSFRSNCSLCSGTLKISQPCKMLVSRPGTIVLNRVQCKLCPKSFRRPDHLKRHERNHEAPRFPCMFPGCGNRFHRRDVLTRHSTSHDWDTFALDTLQEPSQNGGTNRSGDVPSESSIEDPYLFSSLGTVDTLCFESSQTLSFEHFNDSADTGVAVDETVLSACAALYTKYESHRLPFIHAAHATANDSLQYAMAAHGALHSDEYKCRASDLHMQTIHSISANAGSSTLSHFQSRVLAIDFAIWSRDAGRQQWAMKELFNVVREPHQPTKATDGHSSLSWQEWLVQESHKRTSFALFVVAVAASAFLGLPTLIKSQQCPLNLPCDATLWEAETEEAWRLAEADLHASSAETNFQEALHALIRRDALHGYGLEDCSAFNQYVMLYALLETFMTAKSLAANYHSCQDWQHSNSQAFIPRGDFTEALDMCKSLWWASTENLWQTTACSHPRPENIMLLRYLYIVLHSSLAVTGEQPRAYNALAVQAALETFVGCSETGFLRVANTCRSTISRPGRCTAVASARLLRQWAQRIDHCGEELDQVDRAILVQVRQACRRGLEEGAIDNIDSLSTAITELWCTMLGRDWI